MQNIDGRTAVVYRHDPKPESGPVPTEIRVNRTPLRRGEFFHVRRWYLPPEGGQEFCPTRYGVAIPVDYVVDLLGAIELVCPDELEMWLAGEFEGFDLVANQRAWLTRRERRALTREEKRRAQEERRQRQELEKAEEQIRRVMGGSRR